MYKRLLLYGTILGLLTLSLNLAQYRLMVLDHAVEIYGSIIAIVFIVLGIVMGSKLTTPKEIIIEKIVAAPAPAYLPAEQQVEKLGISKRELEVLQLMAQGLSNQEIADQTFVSVNTIKTHVSNILLKLDVKRRTQAVIKARDMKLVA